MSTKGHVTLREILGDEISREDALAIISSSASAQIQFQNLSQEHQEEVLGFVQGIRGLPILYDGFYKYVLDPERHPERLESFLSDLFEQKVTIQEVLTLWKIARENSKKRFLSLFIG